MRFIPSALSALFLILILSAAAPAQEPPAPSAPADTAAFLGNVFEMLRQHPLPYDQEFSSLPLERTATQSVNLVQIRGRLAGHYHVAHDEIVYVIQGSGTLTAGDETRPLRPGDLAFLPRGTVHSVEVRSAQPLAALSIMSPPFDGADRVFVK
ncbi:MAG: cupin domain-containing protein [Candidatus Zixiibacteriota bacterium]|nr:MAG: cupin domain-containing protein [candidate division Zixibacteria bacterium]